MRVINNLANIEQLLGRHCEAINMYKLAIELNPRNAYLHNNIGLCMQALGRFEEAVTYFKHSIELNTLYSEAHLHLSSVINYNQDKDHIPQMEDLLSARILQTAANAIYILH